MENGKRICDFCEWTGYENQVLMACNPFDTSDTIVGCPNCKSIDSIQLVCDEPKCWREHTCGTVDENGKYRLTCSEHRPKT